MQRYDLSKLDFLTKFTVFLLMFPAASFFVNREYVWLMAIIAALVLLFGKLDLLSLWKNLRIYLFVLAIIFLIIIPLVSFRSFFETFLYGLAVLTRLSLFLVFGLIYTSITNPSEIPQALPRLRIPHRYGILFMISMRLHPQIVREAETVRNALRSRGLEAKFSLLRLRESIKYLSYLMQPILISALEAGMKIGETLTLRGYNPYGKITIPPNQPLKAQDYLILLIGVGVLLLTVFLI